jgi:hypothetical protein
MYSSLKHKLLVSAVHYAVGAEACWNARSDTYTAVMLSSAACTACVCQQLAARRNLLNCQLLHHTSTAAVVLLQ